jgi:hypothetical protein
MPKVEGAPLSADSPGAQTERAMPTYEVELIKPHTHARKDLLPGAKIKVTAEQRTWLKGLGVIAGDTSEK